MRPTYLIAVGCIALHAAAFAATNSPVADAAMKGDKTAVQALLEQKADVNAAQPDGATAIQWAAYRNDLELADLLIHARADVKLANRDGATPLWLAAENGSAAMIEKLIEAGADPNERRAGTGDTPMMMAARNGNISALNVLLDHKANPNLKENLRGTTALMWAAEQIHPEAVKVLLAHGADFNAATEPDTRNSRLNIAPTVQQRIEQDFTFGARRPGRARAGAGAGAAADAFTADDFEAYFRGSQVKDGGGLTPLIYAAREGCLECARILLDSGAKVNQVTNYGWT